MRLDVMDNQSQGWQLIFLPLCGCAGLADTDVLPIVPQAAQVASRKCSKEWSAAQSVLAYLRKQGLEQSAAVGEPQATQSKLTSTVDNVRISSAQMTRLHKLLALAFIMCGWSFRGVDSPHFRNFLSAVRTNYEPPGE